MKLCAFSVLLVVGTGALLANPSGMHLAHGTVSLNEQGGTLELTTGGKTILNWDSFSIDALETTRFVQPDKNSAVLNRVTGGIRSEILGNLLSNGQVYLLNSRGILFGKDATISCGALVASTFDVLDREFIEGGDLHFFGDSDAKIVHLGKTHAGYIALSAQTVEHGGVMDGSRVHLGYQAAIGPSGEVDALSPVEHDGKVFLVIDRGEIRAPGGEVRLLGGEVLVQDDAVIDVSAPDGGGTVLIGGDYQGKGLPVARNTLLARGAKVFADALDEGDGGQVIVWGENHCAFFGNISARGGEKGGDGGFVEVSSKGYLRPDGLADLRAPQGAAGLILYDPVAVTISAAADDACVTIPPYTFAGCGLTTNLDAANLAMQLGLASVTINASCGACGTALVGSITVSTAVSWAAANLLTLMASDVGSFITVNADILATNGVTAAGTDLILLTAPTVTVQAMASSVSVVASSGDVSISGGALSVLAGVAAGEFALVEASTGNVDVSMTGAVTIMGGTSGVGNARAAINGANGGNTITVSCDSLTVTGGSGNIGYAAIETTTGNIDVDVTNTLMINGGSLTTLGGDCSGVIRVIHTGTAGTGYAIDVTFGDLVIVGGTTNQSFGDAGAGISHRRSGTCTVTGNGPASSITLTGGAVTVNPIPIPSYYDGAGARVGNSSHIPSFPVTVAIDCGGPIILNGCPSMTNRAYGFAIFDTTGDMVIGGTTPPASITLNGGNGAAGTTGACRSNGVISIYDGTLDITCVGAIIGTGGTGPGGDVGVEISSSNTSIPAAGLTMDCDSLTFLGGTSSYWSFAAVRSDDVTVIHTTNDIVLTGGMGTGSTSSFIQARELLGGSGSIDITSDSGSLLLNGGSGTTTTEYAPAEIQGLTGPITIDCPNGSVTLSGGSMTAHNGAEIYLQTSGNITITDSTSVSLTGGSTMLGGHGLARIQTPTGNISVSSSGPITLLGGGSTGMNEAFISVTTAGDITVPTCTSLTLTGGTSSLNSDARITTDSGNISVTSIGAVMMTGGTGTGSSALVQTGVSGDIDILATGPVTLTGGASAGIAVAGILTNGTGSITIDSSSLLLTAGSGGLVDQANAEISSGLAGSVNTLDVTVTGTVILNGGSSDQNAYLRTRGLAGSNIVIDAPLGVEVNGSTVGGSTTARAAIYTEIGNIDITSNQDVDVIGGSGMDNTAAIGGPIPNGSMMNGDIDILCNNCNIFSGSVPTSIATVESLTGDISIICQTNLNMSGTPGTQPAQILTHGSDIFLFAFGSHVWSGALVGVMVAPCAPGDLLAIANFDVLISNLSQVFVDGGGTLTLVSDNIAPIPDNIGPGLFQLDATSVIRTTPCSNNLKLFTAVRGQDIFAGLINGAAFVPGVLYVNSDREQWHSYFNFTGFYGGFPFTIYYKDYANAAFTRGITGVLVTLGGSSVMPVEGTGYFTNFTCHLDGVDDYTGLISAPYQDYSFPRTLHQEKVGRPPWPMILRPPVFIAQNDDEIQDKESL